MKKLRNAKHSLNKNNFKINNIYLSKIFKIAMSVIIIFVLILIISLINKNNKFNTAETVNENEIIALYGDNDSKTSILVNSEVFRKQYEYNNEIEEKGTAKGIVLATTKNYPDALVSSPLASALHYPIITADDKYTIANSVIHLCDSSYMNNLNYIIIGGINAMPADVVDYIVKTAGSSSNIIELAGEDRCETAKKIYEYGKSLNLWSNNIVIASKDNFGDVTSISSYCCINNTPILLGKTKDDLKENYPFIYNFERYIIIGGYDAIQKFLEEEMADESGKSIDSFKRICGKDRYDTSLEITKTLFNDIKTVTFIYGDNFSDILSTSSLCKQENTPIILIQKDNSYNKIRSILTEITPYSDSDITKLYYVGKIGGDSKALESGCNFLCLNINDVVTKTVIKDYLIDNFVNRNQ